MSETNSESHLDQAKVEAFGDRFLAVLNNGAFCLMVSVGHQTCLFDAMCKMPPATSEDIASQSGLNERYVREWLGAMVTAGVVEVYPETNHLWRTGPATRATRTDFVPQYTVKFAK